MQIEIYKLKNIDEESNRSIQEILQGLSNSNMDIAKIIIPNLYKTYKQYYNKFDEFEYTTDELKSYTEIAEYVRRNYTINGIKVQFNMSDLIVIDHYICCYCNDVGVSILI